MTGQNPWIASAADHYRAGRLDEALAAYREALRGEPADGEALTGLCQILDALGRSDEGVPFLDRALSLGNTPDGPTPLDYAWHCFQLGQVDEAVGLFRELDAACAEAGHAGIATIIPGSPASGNQDILDARRAWARLCVPSARQASFRKPARTSHIPLRIGYVSSFFQNHNWMKPVWGLIHQHDRAQFQVHLFSDAPSEEIQQGYRPHPEDRFHDISGLSNEAAADQIEQSGIDLLIDLNGYSQVQRLPLFGLRPAPVIVEWFNMYATTGMSAIDYLIGDDVVIPPEEEKYYCEKIIRVKGSYLTFEFSYPAPPVVEPPCGDRERFTFGCLAPLYKITQDVVAAWSRILHAAPGSVLRLRNSALGLPEAVESVRAQFREREIPSERLLLDGPAEHFDFLRTYDQIDLALDTFPYSGGTTTTEAIWQGVPVVTFHGDRWAARTSASILRASNLGEFVGRSLEDYISIATGIANLPGRREYLAEHRCYMRPRLRQSPVCDTAGFARNMEQIYREIGDRTSTDLADQHDPYLYGGSK